LIGFIEASKDREKGPELRMYSLDKDNVAQLFSLKRVNNEEVKGW
jgi:hypothetical protein